MNEEKRSYVNDDEMEIDLRQLLMVLKKWARLIIIMTLLSGLAAYIISTYVLTPVYQAKTLLMVTQAAEKLQTSASNRGDDLSDVVGSVSRIPVYTMSTYLGQLKSEALMHRIIDRLDLPYSAGGLASMIEAAVVKDSNLIEVMVTNTDPAMTARIGNTLSTEYLQLMNEKSQLQLSRSVAFLEEQETINSNELMAAEDRLQDFKSQPRGVAVLEAEFASLSKDLDSFTSRLKMNFIEIEQFYSGVTLLEHELAKTPASVRVEVWSDASAGIVYTQEVNPLYMSISEQLSAKRAGLAEKQGENAGLQMMLVSINEDLDALQGEMAEKTMEQERLQREVDRLRETSNTLIQKGTETKIAKSIDLGDTSVMVVSEASIPGTPVKPNKQMNVAIAMLLGLMLFTLLAFLLEYLDNTLKNPEDVTRELELPVLGIIPRLTKKNTPENFDGLITSSSPKSPIAEAYRTLRTNIGFASVDKKYRSILITSTSPQDGKSTTAANLAVAMAQAGNRVVLVDCDLRKPIQHKNFNKDNSRGLTNLLMQGLPLDQVVQKAMENLDVLTSGPIPPNPSEMLSSEKVQSLWPELLKRYDYILIDSPPVLAVADASILASQVEAVISVVKSGTTRNDMGRMAKDQLMNANAKMIGTVLNGIKAESKDYQYYYYYYSNDSNEVEKPRFFNLL